jgi:hypothetical protein
VNYSAVGLARGDTDALGFEMRWTWEAREGWIERMKVIEFYFVVLIPVVMDIMAF